MIIVRGHCLKVIRSDRYLCIVIIFPVSETRVRLAKFMK